MDATAKIEAAENINDRLAAHMAGEPKPETEEREEPRPARNSVDEAASAMQAPEPEEPKPELPPIPRVQAMPAPPPPNELGAFVQQEAQRIQHEEQQLAQIERAINWKELRELDPAEWAARKTEFNHARNVLDSKKKALKESVDGIQSAAQQRQMAEHDKRLAEGRGRLFGNVPELKDEQEQGRLKNYLRQQGFTDHDIANASDPRLLEMAYKALRYDQGGRKSGIRVRRKQKAENPAQAEIKRRNLHPNGLDAAAIRLANALR